MANTVKYERREWYDNRNTGNYNEDKSKRITCDVTEERVKAFVDMWTKIGCTHYETSKAHFYEYASDARHFTQYILYK